MAKWFIKKTAVDIGKMSETLQISPLLSTVLANRGIKTKSDALAFLHPDMERLHPAADLKDMDKAVAIVREAVAEGRRIAVYGDYDVDGVMSAAILYRALKQLGADICCYIPHREEEGYGLNIGAVNRLREQGVRLILTCDNGIAAIAEVARAKELGMKVVVIDHHEPAFDEQPDGTRTDRIPGADAVIDPKQRDCAYPFKQMCAAGLVYRFVDYFYTQCAAACAEREAYLVLAAVATVCDIVDLTGENRTLVKHGLALLNTRRGLNVGLEALLAQRNLLGQTIGSFEIGFVVGPCINASGRLETAETAVRLLTGDDAEEAAALAQKLAELNDERKALTARATDAILARLRETTVLDKVLVLYEPTVHESIVGIVAGRVKDTFFHPTVVITDSARGVKGSARSVEGYHIFEALLRCKELFERFGGHAMAAGLSMERHNIEPLRTRLNSECLLSESDFTQIVHIDKEIPLSQVTFERADELRQLEPFGKANHAPVFATKDLTADLVETIGKDKKTLRFTFTDEQTGRRIKGVCFQKLEQFVALLGEKYGERMVEKFKFGRIAQIRIDVIYNIAISEYNNNTYVDMRIIDFR